MLRQVLQSLLPKRAPLPGQNPAISQEEHVAALQIAHQKLAAGDAPAAEILYRDWLRHDSDHPEAPVARRELATALSFQGRNDAAIACLQEALTRAEDAQTHCNLAFIYHQTGQLDAACQHYERTLALDVEHTQAHHNLALIRLLLGDYAAAWPHFERRLTTPPPYPFWLRDVLPLYHALGHGRVWQGNPVEKLLLVSEQGLGDTLMMLRYLPLLKNKKGVQQVFVHCEPELMRLVGFLPGIDGVSTKPDAPTSAFDAHLPMMSLPSRFATQLDSIPNDMPYLRVPQHLVDAWQARLHPLPGLKVGLVWGGRRKETPRRAHLSLHLDSLQSWQHIPDVSWVSLQKGAEHDEQRTALATPWPMAHWMDECADFMDTAALVRALDLVISVDTSVAHLAGALGKPVWLLNRFESEWRWLLCRSDSPWYPSMRIFRQAAAEDWQSVIQAVAQALRQQTQGC